MKSIPPGVCHWSIRPKPSWSRTRRCCRSPGNGSTRSWYDYVKGLNPVAYFGIFDVVRLDTVWLGKT